MKLAEALILRADCQKRIAQLKGRLLVNAKVQEGDAPAETPQELIAELGRVSTELLDLIKRINRTNARSLGETEGLGSHRPRSHGVRLLLHPHFLKINVQVASEFPPGPADGLSLLNPSSWKRSF